MGVLLASCQPMSRPEAANQDVQEYMATENPIVDVWSSIEVNTEKPDLANADENLFGKFYNDRIEFHIIDEPDIQLHEAEVSKITLYYIDGVLCRKKYELDRAIADELVIKYGAVSYKSLNHATDSLAREMGIVLSSANGNRFNPYLKKYRLRWKLSDMSIYFLHEEDSTAVINQYIEEMVEYRQLYKSVQKELI